MEEQVGERFPSLWGSAEQQLKQMFIHIVICTCRKENLLLYAVGTWCFLEKSLPMDLTLERRKCICKKGVKTPNLTTEIKIITFLFCLFLSMCRLVRISVQDTNPVFSMSEPKGGVAEPDTDFQLSVLY